MNILQIARNACSVDRVMNADGVSRVVARLCRYLTKEYNDTCYLGYYTDENPKETVFLPEFSNTIHFNNPIDKTALADYITSNCIEIIQINLPVSKQYASHIKTICDTAHYHNVKVVFCLHVMPGFEGKEYGSFKEVLFSFLTRKKTFSKIRNWLITAFSPISNVLLEYAFRSKYQSLYHCDKIVLFSDSYIDTFLKIVKNNDHSKLYTIPNPLPFNDCLSEEEVKNKSKEVILVGRLAEDQKRISYALKIWQLIETNPMLVDWKLSVVGNGKDEAFCFWLAKKYNLKRISFEGRQDPKPYYKRASIIMLTSGYEGWPMVLMEAMPMGCCSISFDSFGAIYDIIEDGYNGKIVPNNDIHSYYKVLSEIMLDNSKRTEMSIHAIESSHRFTMEIIGKRWRELYSELSEEKRFNVAGPQNSR